MSTALAVTPRFASDVPLRTRAYLQAVASWSNSDHEAVITRRQLAVEMGCSESTVIRAHRDASARDLVERTDGGHRGRAQRLVLTCMRGLREQERKAVAAIKRRQRLRMQAAQAIANASASRTAAFAARIEGLAGRAIKGVTDDTPHSSYGEGRSQTDTADRLKDHVADPDEYGGCRRCPLPAANRVHRRR